MVVVESLSLSGIPHVMKVDDWRRARVVRFVSFHVAEIMFDSAGHVMSSQGWDWACWARHNACTFNLGCFLARTSGT